MTIPKFEIVSTVVNAKARNLNAKFTLEEPTVIRTFGIEIDDTIVPKWNLHKKFSLKLDREFIMHRLDADNYLDEVQTWCQETGNGRRTSYDTFHFSKPAKMTAFLLRWNNG